ncbi:MAG: SpoIID/LytB domain-containing protein [Oscillospiraceae bacterium]|nr:SpoIID/LytB domain-containing protein [Oscillospiraceae bacterium]
MKKISLLKIIIALCICNVYVFTCGVMGEIKSVDISARAEDIPKQPTSDSDGEDEGANGQGTVDFLVPDAESSGTMVNLQFMNFQQASMADKVVYTTMKEITEDIPEADTLPTTEQEVLVVPSEDEDEPESSSSVTTPVTTTKPVTVTTPVTTTKPITTTTPMGIPVDGPSEVPDDKPSEEPVVSTPVTTTPKTTTTTTTAKPVESEPEDIVTDPNAANEILTVNNGGTIVSGNAVDIISAITQNEVGYTFAPEAIKAQAVAAYTYVKYYNDHGMNPSVILSKSVNDSVRVLVTSVIGQAVYYNGDPIQAVYSASSAGYTASSLTVWGNEYPYLVSKFCELDEMYDPNYGRTKEFTSEDIKARVYNATGISLTGDPSTWLSVDEYVDHVYVGQMNVGGYHSYINSSGKNVKISGRVFRDTIMDYDIRSYAFDVEYDAATDMFIFTTYGYGHGVGMSQNGAHALATYWGYDYKQILEFYYTGCSVY